MFSTFSRYVCLIFAMVCLAPILDAAAANTYYVRPYQEGGYRDGLGTTYDNAWNSIAGINWNTVTSGDTIMICDKHISGKTPVVGEPGTTVNVRGKEVVIGIAKSGIIVDGSCDGHQGTVYPGALFSAGKLNNWIGPDANGVYESTYNNGSVDDLLCEDGQPLTKHVTGSAWQAGQYERRWVGGNGTIYYKPYTGIATDHKTTLHRPSTTPDCAEISVNNGGTWDFNFSTWRDIDNDGTYEITKGQYLISSYLLETDTNQDHESLLTWRHAYIGSGGVPPDANWTPGSFSYVVDPSDFNKSTLYYRPTSGTPVDHRIYGLAYTIISIFDASDVTIRNLKLFGGIGGEISVYHATNAVIDNNELQWGGHAVYISENSDNGLFINNHIHNLKCGSGIYFGIGTGFSDVDLGNSDNWYVAYNHIHDISQYAEGCLRQYTSDGSVVVEGDRHAIGLEGGNNNTIEHNHIHHSGGEGIVLYNWSHTGTHTQRNNTIRYNYIHDIEDLAFPEGCRKVGNSSPPPPAPGCSTERGIDFGGDSYIPKASLTYGNIVHHNLFQNIGTLAFRFKGSWSAETGPTWKIFNNVVVGAGQGIAYVTGSGTQTLETTGEQYFAKRGVEFANNIFVNTGVAASLTIPIKPGSNPPEPDSVTPATMAFNNIYYNTDGTTPGFTVDSISGNSLATWQNRTGLDQNSITDNPQLVGQISGFLADFDFRPSSITSSVFNAGAPISVTQDYAGNSIAGPIDIGAFEIQYADLVVTVTDTPDPANTDSPMSYGIIATNAGPSAATSVVVTHTLPGGVTGSGLPSQGSCTGTSVISCSLGTLGNGQSATVTVTATPGAEALFDPTPSSTFNVNVSAGTTVSAAETDILPANNSATTSTNVRLACLGKVVTKRGTSGNDGTSNKRFAGGNNADVIHTLSGTDWIDGKGGNDTICGGAGNDNINGSGGADALSGGTGTDTCNGGSGTDSSDGSCETVNSVP